MSLPARSESALAALDESDVARDPVKQFLAWFAQAREAVREPHAMTLATARRDGTPSARIVLLKEIDDTGLVFYTDYRSRKASDLQDNPRAAVVFFWSELDRQVRISGTVQRTNTDEAAKYFSTRPLGSRLGAWASHQSSVIPGRSWLEERYEEMSRRFGTEPPLPDHWGGFRLVPSEFEFWQSRASRLHDRVRYTRSEEKGWIVERLSP